jgi:hypothetical protein
MSSWLLVFGGCSAGSLPATTVTGLQVVAISATPAQPTPTQPLSLEVWVADGLGLGADVVVWMCTPVDGRCLEFDALPGSDGLPLQFVTKTGPAEPVFRTTVAWPLLADIAREYVAGGGAALDEDLGEGAEGILVWALACVPGLCDVVRAVQADAVAASPTWWDATAALSDPAVILEGVEPGEASIAVKFVPTWSLTDPPETFYAPNLAPSLAVVDASPAQAVTRLSWFDPDGDEVDLQAFTTAGVVSAYRTGPSEVTVVGRPTRTAAEALLRDPTWRAGDTFLVAEDGRGGTAVWSSTASQREACEPELTLPDGPSPGGTLEVAGSFAYVQPQLRGFTTPTQVVGSLSTADRSVRWSGSTRVVPSGSYEYTTYGGVVPGEPDPCQRIPLGLELWAEAAAPDPCAFGGTPLTLTLSATADGDSAVVEVPVIARSPSYLFCP